MGILSNPNANGISPGSQGRQTPAAMFQYSTSTNGGIQFTTGSTLPDADDWRVKISLAPGAQNAGLFYFDPTNALLQPLITEVGGTKTFSTISKSANSGRVGVVFPYTPQIQIVHRATYQEQKLTHNNYSQYYYENSGVEPITISGDFTVQNLAEGRYLLATTYFFRACTKMFFGTDQLAGNPPPMVYLNGFGQYILPNVPCVITNFQQTLPSDVDYMDIADPALSFNPKNVSYPTVSTRLPTTSTISVTLQPVYSRLAQSQGFSLTDFAKGAMLNTLNTGNPATAFGAQAKATNSKLGLNGGFL